ncbi:MAG: hypothetical protein QNK05_10085 [Myxococcota bacterium]|nr:hypothetical protein [Myxococcota bacterium]
MGQEKRRRCAWCGKPLTGESASEPAVEERLEARPGDEEEDRDADLSFGICRSCRLDRGLSLPRTLPRRRPES